jgi:hypothetical protein
VGGAVCAQVAAGMAASAASAGKRRIDVSIIPSF